MAERKRNSICLYFYFNYVAINLRTVHTYKQGKEPVLNFSFLQKQGVLYLKLLIMVTEFQAIKLNQIE